MLKFSVHRAQTEAEQKDNGIMRNAYFDQMANRGLSWDVQIFPAVLRPERLTIIVPVLIDFSTRTIKLWNSSAINR